MPTPLGAHNARIEAARALLVRKGRSEQGRFSFEGPTLLAEAAHAGLAVGEIYATAEAYERTPLLRDLEASGTAIYLVDARTMARISDVETPSGLVAVAARRETPLETLFGAPGVVLILAGLTDPGNAGTLLRSAQAFGARGVLFGSGSVDPYLPKVVRSAMGALFRLPVGSGNPSQAAQVLEGWRVTGLTSSGQAIGSLEWGEREALVVGAERAGLGPWSSICARFAAIPMPGAAESLNAAVAGSIALYEAAGRRTT